MHQQLQINIVFIIHGVELFSIYCLMTEVHFLIKHSFLLYVLLKTIILFDET